MVRPDPRYGETISLSSQTIKIINDIQSGLISAPDWFNNNIQWVQDGHMSESEFITSYDYLVSSGTIHAQIIPEPIPIIPEPKPVSLYWVQKPSQQPAGLVEAYHITESTKQKWLSNGYIISLTEPKYQSGRVLWETKDTVFPIGMNTNQIGTRYTVQTPEPTPIIPTPEPISAPTPEPPAPTPEPTPEPPAPPPPEPTPEIDTSITDNMIIQRLDSFSIVNGRAIGQITFTATDSFNPYYYNKNITNIISFKTPNGVNILQFVKQNTLRFTATERTETIQYDEGMNDNTRANVESFVWSGVTQPTPFSKQLKFEIVTAQEGQPAPVPTVQTSGFMGAGVAGAIAGLILIGFIADHKRGK